MCWFCFRIGYINYSEFVGACLARKEGLRREYAELIFKLYPNILNLITRVDRDNEDFISIDDLHRFFGDDISVDEIEAVIKQTFGRKKEQLTEQDLEMILNTKVCYFGVDLSLDDHKQSYRGTSNYAVTT